MGRTRRGTYTIQTAAASDKAASEMGRTFPKPAPTNNVHIKVLNNNRVKFDEQQQQNLFQGDSEEYEREEESAPAMTSVLRALHDNRRLTEDISRQVNCNDNWKTSATCYHCGDTGHIATDCDGRCPSCQGYRG